MNTALWVIQGLAALGFLAAGGFKASSRKAELEKKMAWAKGFTATQVKLIGLAEIAGAIGLILPWATGIVPVLTPIAAVCLAIVMGGAVATHVKIKDPPSQAVPSVINLLLTLVIAVGRFGLLG
jgi:hypothetical protein